MRNHPVAVVSKMSPSFHDVSFPDVSTLRKPPFLRNSTSNGGQAARLSAKPSRGRIVITVSKSEAPRARIVILIMYQLSTRRLQLQHPSHYIWRCQLLVVVLFCFFFLRIVFANICVQIRSDLWPQELYPALMLLCPRVL